MAHIHDQTHRQSILRVKLPHTVCIFLYKILFLNNARFSIPLRENFLTGFPVLRYFANGYELSMPIVSLSVYDAKFCPILS